MAALGSQQGLAVKQRANGCSTALGKTKKCIYTGGLNDPPLSLYPGGGLGTSWGLGLGLLFVLAQECQKVDTGDTHTEDLLYMNRRRPYLLSLWRSWNQPETSGNFGVLRDCKEVSNILTGLGKATVFHTHPSNRNECSLPPGWLLTHVLQTCKTFSEKWFSAEKKKNTLFWVKMVPKQCCQTGILKSSPKREFWDC